MTQSNSPDSEKKPTPEPFFASTASPLDAEVQEIVNAPEPSMGWENTLPFFMIGVPLNLFSGHEIYRNCLKNRNYAEEAPQNFDSERATIAEWQGARENRNCEVKPTTTETDSSDYFGIHPRKLRGRHFIEIEDFNQNGFKTNLSYSAAPLRFCCGQLGQTLLEQLGVVLDPFGHKDFIPLSSIIFGVGD